MKKNPLFFIALLPPDELQREVAAFKRHIAEKWGSQHALNSPPHLTLQPPFGWPEHDLDALKKCLSRFAARQFLFAVELDGFGAFPPRVVFIKLVKNKLLNQLFHHLVTCLERELGFSDPRNKRPYHPHMTIAHRDLDERDFPDVWASFREKKYERQFQADALTLLRNVRGKWEVEEQFPFAPGIEH
ncbi:MAG: 2'-5' RNA ligase family protein [Haliscomenobacteraceae bacterium CHB4]|nr:RNA 2',3'-cyclic phosphodiesterase [Saprospiraceae bacterium]MCE7926436.1 2'-5' RNA ligase family protein [Haliscomenobacteraceae bacterium CHB4]